MNTVNNQKIALYNQSITKIINNYFSFIEGLPNLEIEGIKEKYTKILAQEIVDKCHEDKLKVSLPTILSIVKETFSKASIGCSNKLTKELYNVVYDMQRSSNNKEIIYVETRYSNKFIDDAMPSTFEYKEINSASNEQPFFPNMKQQNTLVKKITENIHSKVVISNSDRFSNNSQNIITDKKYSMNSSLFLYQEIERIIEKNLETMQMEVNNLELDYVYDRIVGAGTLLKTCISNVITTDQSREVFNRFDIDTDKKYQSILPMLSIPKEDFNNYNKAM